MSNDRAAIEQELLVLRCQRGDRDAFEELIGRWERRLFYYIKRLVRDEDEAWQLLQEVWVQTLRSIQKLRSADRLPVWLYAIARNMVMTHHRDEYARERLLSAVVPDCATSGDVEQFQFDDADQIHHGLSRIPRDDREILTLFFLRDLSVAEVGQLLGIPAGTVKSRLFKARQLLRDVLKGDGENHE
jgi:RNA polymerase sigma-70 factor (ECF subfamily)